MAKLSSLLVDLEVNSAALRTGLDEANGHLRKFAKNVETVGRAIGAAFAVSAVFDFAKDAINAFAATEKAERQLSAVLKQVGYDAEQVGQAFRSQALALQGTLGVSDDVVSQMQTLLVRFGVAPDQIGKAVSALLDYSTAMGVDGVAATEQFVKGLDRGGDALRQMGVNVELTGDKSRDLDTAVEKMGKRFGGAALANAQTFGGQMQMVATQFEELEKGLGGLLATIEQKLGVMRGLAAALEAANYAISGDQRADHQKNLREEEKATITARLGQLNGILNGGGTLTGDQLEEFLKIKNRLAELEARQRATSGALPSVAPTMTLEPLTVTGRFASEGKADDSPEKFGEKIAKNASEWMIKHNDALRKAQQEFADSLTDWSDVQKNLAEEQKKAEEAGQKAFEKQMLDRAREEEKAADAAKRAADALAELRARAAEAALSFVQGAVGRLGRLGGVVGGAVSTAQQGFQIGQAAGPEGAAAGVAAGAAVGALMELVTNSRGFREALAMLDDVMVKLGDVTGVALEGADVFLGALHDLALSGLQPVSDALRYSASAWNKFAPIVELYGVMIDATAKALLGFVNDSTATGPAMKLFEQAGRFFFDAAKGGGLALLTYAKAIAEFWDGFVNLSQSIFASLSNLPGVGAAFAAIAASFDTYKIGTGGITDAINTLSAATYDGLKAKAEETAATYRNAAAVDAATASFLNAPSGYRVALREFGADIGGGASVPGAHALFGDATITINVANGDPQAILDALKNAAQREEFVRRGSIGRRRLA